MNIYDIDIENRVIDNKDENNKYTHDEKIKYLEDAIRNGGYYGDDGTWNSIAVFSGDKRIYRIRVETLIIKDDKFIYLKFLPKNRNRKDNRIYLVPGGSVSKDSSNMDQAINECKEEARITVKNIKSTGITYKESTYPSKLAIATQAVNWNGNYTEVYVAEYHKPYRGHIEKVDEDKFMITGKFYNIDKIYRYLRKEHKKALQIIYPNRFNGVSSKITMENTLTVDERNKLDNSQFGIPSLRKFPLHDRNHVMQAIRFFNTVDKEHERELASNIITAMNRYNINLSIIGERNRLRSYL
jgi:8-oxo-dGTP pyrophosphatase MutT (NUDIX family)